MNSIEVIIALLKYISITFEAITIIIDFYKIPFSAVAKTLVHSMVSGILRYHSDSLIECCVTNFEVAFYFLILRSDFTLFTRGIPLPSVDSTMALVHNTRN